MRHILFIALVLAIAGCGNDNSNNGNDLAVAADLAMSAGPDMAAVVPFNMPGSVFCYKDQTGNPLTCSTTGANPICCDQSVDGGFSDSCVANTGACGGKTYQCGQAADCGNGQVCCGMKNGSGSQLRSTTCAASCTGGQVQLCVNKTECKTGTMCVGAYISGRDVGFCM